MLDELVALEELCSEVDEATLELESSRTLLDESGAIEELEIAEELEITAETALKEIELRFNTFKFEGKVLFERISSK